MEQEVTGSQPIRVGSNEFEWSWKAGRVRRSTFVDDLCNDAPS